MARDEVGRLSRSRRDKGLGLAPGTRGSEYFSMFQVLYWRFGILPEDAEMTVWCVPSGPCAQEHELHEVKACSVHGAWPGGEPMALESHTKETEALQGKEAAVPRVPFPVDSRHLGLEFQAVRRPSQLTVWWLNTQS